MERLRSASLLLAGAYAVHTLRYVLAYGSEAGDELLAQGHGYLVAAPIALTAILAVATGHLIMALARRPPAKGAPPAVGRLWALFATALLAFYAVQESAEGLLAAGHPEGLPALLDHGGWIAVGLSAAVGLGLALLHRGARALLATARGSLILLRPRTASALVPALPLDPRGCSPAGSWLRCRAPPGSVARP
jgi:hypothetical protein